MLTRKDWKDNLKWGTWCTLNATLQDGSFWHKTSNQTDNQVLWPLHNFVENRPSSLQTATNSTGGDSSYVPCEPIEETPPHT